MIEILNFDFVFNQNEEVFNMKLECTNGRFTTSYKIKLLILYIYIYMSTEGCDFVQYSYHKTAHCTTQYDAVHCHLW